MLTATTHSTLYCKVCSWSSTEEGRAGEESASGGRLLRADCMRFILPWVRKSPYLALGKEVTRGSASPRKHIGGKFASSSHSKLGKQKSGVNSTCLADVESETQRDE